MIDLFSFCFMNDFEVCFESINHDCFATRIKLKSYDLKFIIRKFQNLRRLGVIKKSEAKRIMYYKIYGFFMTKIL